MRQEFAIFIQAQTASESVAADEGIKLLRLLNAKYKARYPVAALPIVYESAVSTLHEQGWWNGQAPNLLQATDDQVQQVLNVLTSILSRVDQHHVPQPYSLLTKWLHFCFPDTFVIFDSQAANSIQTCSDFMHGHLGPQSSIRRQFRRVSIYEKGGKGYMGLLRFYYLCGQAADEGGLMGALLKSSQQMEAVQHQIPGCLNTRISVLDVLDKHFWKANGDAHKLGIA